MTIRNTSTKNSRTMACRSGLSLDMGLCKLLIAAECSPHECQEEPDQDLQCPARKRHSTRRGVELERLRIEFRLVDNCRTLMERGWRGRPGQGVLSAGQLPVVRPSLKRHKKSKCILLS
eukprot:766099-Hanusia_phi.AAC.2